MNSSGGARLQAMLCAALTGSGATNQEGLYALAKDLIRLTADCIDAKAIQTLVCPPKGVQWGSLKSLEKLLATRIEAEEAATLMSPLFGLYELRHADAHLVAEHEIEEALAKVGVNRGGPLVSQGFELVHACVTVVLWNTQSAGQRGRIVYCGFSLVSQEWPWRCPSARILGSTCWSVAFGIATTSILSVLLSSSVRGSFSESDQIRGSMESVSVHSTMA